MALSPANIPAILDKYKKGQPVNSEEEAYFFNYIYSRIENHPMVNDTVAGLLHENVDGIVGDLVYNVYDYAIKYFPSVPGQKIENFIYGRVKQHLQGELRKRKDELLGDPELDEFYRSLSDPDGDLRWPVNEESKQMAAEMVQFIFDYFDDVMFAGWSEEKTKANKELLTKVLKGKIRGLTVDEIAEELDISKGKAYTFFYHIKEALSKFKPAVDVAIKDSMSDVIEDVIKELDK